MAPDLHEHPRPDGLVGVGGTRAADPATTGGRGGGGVVAVPHARRGEQAAGPSEGAPDGALGVVDGGLGGVPEGGLGIADGGFGGAPDVEVSQSRGRVPGPGPDRVPGPGLDGVPGPGPGPGPDGVPGPALDGEPAPGLNGEPAPALDDGPEPAPDDEPEGIPAWVLAIHVEQDRAAGLALLLSTVPGVDGVSTVRPGVPLAARLDSTDLRGVGDAALVEIVAAWQRMQSWVHAHTARAAAELAGRTSMNPSWNPAAGPPAQSCVAGDELAMRLGVSRRSATRLVEHGQAFAGVLGATGRALALGQITATVADRIADRLGDQPVPVAMEAEDRVLLDAGNRTPTQIDRDLSRALLVVDPHDAAHRAERARARRCVHRPRALPDGMASLTAVLPAGTAVRIDASLDAAARTARSAGDPRTLDQLRADGLRDLVLHTACTGSDATGAALDLAASGLAAPGPAASGLAAPDLAARDLAAPALADLGVGDGSARAPGGRVRSGASDGDGCDEHLPDDHPGCPTAPHHRTEVRVTVALSTLLGIDENPADLAGIGAVDATTARVLAEGGVWRRIVTDPLSGTVLDVGRSTYRPPRGLARHVRVRDQVCARPGCSAPAEACDLDHTVEFHDPPDGQEPGTTAHDNLGPLCRRDHRLKTDGGFTLRQTVPGTYVWTTPAGHQHVVVPGDDGRHRHLGTLRLPEPAADAGADPPPPF